MSMIELGRLEAKIYTDSEMDDWDMISVNSMGMDQKSDKNEMEGWVSESEEVIGVGLPSTKERGLDAIGLGVTTQRIVYLLHSFLLVVCPSLSFFSLFGGDGYAFIMMSCHSF